MDRTELKKVGFWRRTEDTKILGPTGELLPWPTDHVDHDWDMHEKMDVLAHMRINGKESNRYRGFSLCRICECANGSCDISDGTYVWPQGFDHYIMEHDVKPPQEFIEHALLGTKLKSTDHKLSPWMIVCEECLPQSLRYEELTIGIFGPRQCELCKKTCGLKNSEAPLSLHTPRRGAVRGILMQAGAEAVLEWLVEHDMGELADTIRENLR